MTDQVANPVGLVLKLFQEIDQEGPWKAEFEKPATRYELTEAMLKLANMQMIQLDLTLAVMNRNQDEIKSYLADLIDQLKGIIEVTIGLGGTEFGMKAVEALGGKDV